MIVLDASATVEWLRLTPVGRALARRLGEATSVHVPELWELEVQSAVRRLHLAGKVSLHRAERMLELVGLFGAVRHAHRELTSRTWELRDTVSTYDAAYVALAEALDAPLVTTDARLARSPGHLATVEVIA